MDRSTTADSKHYNSKGLGITLTPKKPSLFKDLDKETIKSKRNPKKGSFFRIHVGFRILGLVSGLVKRGFRVLGFLGFWGLRVEVFRV